MNFPSPGNASETALGSTTHSPPLPVGNRVGDSLSAEIMRIAAERQRFIMANRERLLEAFMAETGLTPSECVQCVQTMRDGTIRFWVERRGPSTTPPIL